MGYKHIKKVNCSKERKKVVGARVPVDILNAIQDAESDSGQTGFTLSITEIIENALLDTLQELNQATGIDYHELSILKGELYDYVGPADVDTEENLNEVINSLHCRIRNCKGIHPRNIWIANFLSPFIHSSIICSYNT